MPPWWGTREHITGRLQVEVKAMRDVFRDTFTLNVPKWGSLFWTGTVYLNMKRVEVREHTLKIIYPQEFPYKPPKVYVIQPRIKSDLYQYDDGQLSLFNPSDGPDYGWNPSRSTAAAITGWA